jgi:single-strand DNA-binding protein
VTVINTNRVILTGRLTSDPTLRELASGLTVCQMRLAVNALRRDTTTECWDEKPNFFDVTIFGGKAQSAAQFLRRGRPVAVDGRLQSGERQTRDGHSVQTVTVIADNVEPIGGLPPDRGDAALDIAEEHPTPLKAPVGA